MTEQQGPIYEYMMGTFDLQEATWMSSMNDMLNNFGLAGWKRSVVTLLDARHVLVVMERRFPSAAEYAASQPVEARQLKPMAEPVADYDSIRETIDDGLDKELARVAEADEYDDEAEALMAAKVAEVIPWAARSTVPRKGPKNGRRRRKKVAHIAQRNKAVT